VPTISQTKRAGFEIYIERRIERFWTAAQEAGQSYEEFFGAVEEALKTIPRRKRLAGNWIEELWGTSARAGWTCEMFSCSVLAVLDVLPRRERLARKLLALRQLPAMRDLDDASFHKAIRIANIPNEARGPLQKEHMLGKLYAKKKGGCPPSKLKDTYEKNAGPHR